MLVLSQAKSIRPLVEQRISSCTSSAAVRSEESHKIFLPLPYRYRSSVETRLRSDQSRSGLFPARFEHAGLVMRQRWMDPCLRYLVDGGLPPPPQVTIYTPPFVVSVEAIQSPDYACMHAFTEKVMEDTWHSPQHKS